MPTYSTYGLLVRHVAPTVLIREAPRYHPQVPGPPFILPLMLAVTQPP